MKEFFSKLSQFENLQKIAEGGSSKIYQAYDNNKKQGIAIKYINMGTLKDYGQQKVSNEIKIMESLKSSKNIVKFFDTMVISETKICIMMELCQTDLQKLRSFMKKKIIPQQYIVSIVKQIVNGLDEMISKKIFFRDLKMENILVKISEEDLEELKEGDLSKLQSAKFVICDFGNSKIMQNLSQQFRSSVGSHGSMAPEVFEGKFYDIKSLIYSLGILIFELISGNDYFELKYNQNDTKPIRFKKKDIDIDSFPIPEIWKKMIHKMLKKDPDKRLKWDELRSIVLEEDSEEFEQQEDSNYIVIDEPQTDVTDEVNKNKIKQENSSNTPQVKKKKKKAKNQGKDNEYIQNLKQQEDEIVKKIKDISDMIQTSYNDLNQSEIFKKCSANAVEEVEVEEEKKKHEIITEQVKYNFNHNKNYDNYMQFYKKNYPVLRAKYHNLEAYEINVIIGQKWREFKSKMQETKKKQTQTQNNKNREDVEEFQKEGEKPPKKKKKVKND